MSKSDEYNVIQSLKIQVDNDRINKPGDGSDGESMEEDEYEEGEASSDDDEEVEVNVIVGSGGNKPDTEPLDCDSKKILKSIGRDGEPSFYRPPATREKSFNNESENLKSFFKSNYSSKSRPITENEELPYDFIDDSYSKQKILEERAKRFGFQRPMLSLDQIQQLYNSLEISNDDFIRGGFRADSIHCRGFENCKSSEIFHYFKDYNPHSIEWLTKTSCNVTWLRKEDAMRALVGLSCPIKPSKPPQNSKIKNKKSDNNKENSKSVSVKVEGTVEKKGKKEKKKSSQSDSSSSSSSGSSSSSSSSESDDEDSSSSSSSNSSGSSSSGSSSSSSSDSSSSSSSSSDSENENESKKPSPLREVTKEIHNNNNNSSNTTATTTTTTTTNNNNNNSLSNFNNAATSENNFINSRTVSPSQMAVDTVNDTNDYVDDMDGSVSADYVGVVIPPGRWRLGVPCPNTKAILMRYAHCKDKKLPGLEKPIELYQDYLAKKEKRESPKKNRRERTFVKARKHHKTPDVHRPHPPFYGPPQDRLRYDFNPRPPRPPPYSDKFYKDLDDPIEPSGHPWGFLAQNWGKKETQENIDYQELLRQHVTGQKRKRDPSDDESDQEHDRGDFYLSTRKSSHHRSRKSKHRREDYDRYEEEGEEEEEELLGQNINDEEDVVQWNSRIKLPIMRMYADAEEKKNERRKKNLAKGFGNRLSQARSTTWRENRRPPPNSALDLRAKLMRKKLMT